jgi:hypothetical protein
MIFDITVNSYVCMCGNIVLGHTCDEYWVLVTKLGMTGGDGGASRACGQGQGRTCHRGW